MATLDHDILKGTLEKLQGDEPGILGAAIVSPDGLILVSTFSVRDQNDKLAAMTSELLAMGNMSSREMELGSLFLSLVLGTEAGLLVRGLDEVMVLCIIMSRTANVGRVIQLANQTVARLKLTE